MSDRKPHLCPACQGYCRILDRNPLCQTGSSTPLIECPTCKGAGVLWDPFDGAQGRPAADLEARVAALEKVAHPQGVFTDPELTEALKKWNEDRKMLRPGYRGGLLDLFPPLLEQRDGFPHSGVCCSGRPLVFC